jgi:hypothetical protein
VPQKQRSARSSPDLDHATVVGWERVKMVLSTGNHVGIGNVGRLILLTIICAVCATISPSAVRLLLVAARVTSGYASKWAWYSLRTAAIILLMVSKSFLGARREGVEEFFESSQPLRSPSVTAGDAYSTSLEHLCLGPQCHLNPPI